MSVISDKDAVEKLYKAVEKLSNFALNRTRRHAFSAGTAQTKGIKY